MTECPWCMHTFQTTGQQFDSVAALETDKKRKTKSKSKQTAVDEPGVLAPVAGRILMKILWAARYGRFDLLKTVGHLATFITKWTSRQDAQVHRLMGYCKCSRHFRMIGWVGDELGELSPHLFADADFAGCSETQRSTSGYHLVVRGPNTSFPITGNSKRQTCVSHSTPEAELIALSLIHI